MESCLMLDECPNTIWFWSLFGPRKTISAWDMVYNSGPPQSSLAYRPPDELARSGRLLVFKKRRVWMRISLIKTTRRRRRDALRSGLPRGCSAAKRSLTKKEKEKKVGYDFTYRVDGEWGQVTCFPAIDRVLLTGRSCMSEVDRRPGSKRG